MARYKQPYTLIKRTLPSGKVIFYYRTPDNPVQKSTGKSVKWQAREYVEERLAEKKQGVTQVSLEEYARDFFAWESSPWIRRQHAKGKSFSWVMARLRKGHLKNHLLPKFGKRRLSDLNPVEIENWLVGLPLANGTKKDILYTLNIVLREVKREKLIAHNPIDEVEPLAPSYKARDVFTRVEFKKLFPKDDREKLLKIWAGLKYASLFHTMATTEIRSGEARALQWQDVSWDLKGLLILRAVKADGSIGQPKAKEIRPVHLSDQGHKLLSEWHDSLPYTEPEDLIYFGENGYNPLNKHTPLDRFRAALSPAEIEVQGRNLVPHSFQHTYVTLMREVRPEKILREFTGHRTEAMTEHYDHPALEDQRKKLAASRELIQGIWE